MKGKTKTEWKRKQRKTESKIVEKVDKIKDREKEGGTKKNV